MGPAFDLRSVAKRNPAIYLLWLRWQSIRLGKKKNPPAKGDMLYFDGYPRSGNTYFSAGLQHLFPNIVFANHLHAIAPIKIALAKKVPAFILIRSPLEAVSSYVLHVQSSITISSKKGNSIEALCELLLMEWIAYYSYVRQKAPHLTIFESEAAFRNPSGIAEHVTRVLGFEFSKPEIRDRWDRFHESFRKDDQNKPQGSTSFPNAERQSQKRKIRETIAQNGRLPECLKIFKDLRETSAIL